MFTYIIVQNRFLRCRLLLLITELGSNVQGQRIIVEHFSGMYKNGSPVGNRFLKHPHVIQVGTPRTRFHKRHTFTRAGAAANLERTKFQKSDIMSNG
jgi:hypothetical protein